MSNVIEFMESLGANAALAGQSAERYIAAVEALEIEEAERVALLNRDGLAISSLLGGRDKMYCAIVVPAEDEPSQDEEQEVEMPDEREADPDLDQA